MISSLKLHSGAVQTAVSADGTSLRKWPVPDGAVLLHLTHWKAGSQWVRGLLEDAFGSAVVPPEPHVRHFLANPLQPGRVYACGYLAHPEFEALALPPDARCFVVIRDLRDTLVSAYFSLRYTHVANAGVERWRWVLSRMEPEPGLLYLMESWLVQSALIQRTWLAGEREGAVVRLEDFMRDAGGTLHRVLRVHWGLDVTREAAEALAARHTFDRYSGGRVPGEEDRRSHYRKGTHGDWRWHFTPRVADRFKALYQDVLVQAGYEEDDAWNVPQASPQTPREEELLCQP